MKIDYYAYHSGMKNWNAGIKVLLSVVTLCLVIGLNRIPVSLFVVLSMGLLTVFVGRVPGKIYLHYMTVPLVFMIVSTLAIAAGICGASDWRLEFISSFLLSVRDKRGALDGCFRLFKGDGRYERPLYACFFHTDT